MVELELQCYCCGELIKSDHLALVSLSDVACGRVFVFIPAHVERVDGAKVIYVTRQKEPRARRGS